jgi:Tol biopolymer transport system component
MGQGIPAAHAGSVDIPNARGPIQVVGTDSHGRIGQGAMLDEDGWGTSYSWSPDGTRIAFLSDASDLVRGDKNQCVDVFVKNLTTGAIQLASVSANGRQTDDHALDAPSWSPDGQKLVFVAFGGGLVHGDTNQGIDVFVKNLRTGDVERISTNAAGKQVDGWFEHPTWSPDGRHIAFVGSKLTPEHTNRGNNIYVKNVRTGALRIASRDAAGNLANGDSSDPAWSPNGKKLAFTSNASNLVPNAPAQGLYIKNLSTSAIRLIAPNAGGFAYWYGSGNQLAWSPDGHRLAFTSSSRLTTDVFPEHFSQAVYVKDLRTTVTTLVSRDKQGPVINGGFPSWSPDGSKLAMTMGSDVVVLKLRTGELRRVSTTAQGAAANRWSYDSRWSPTSSQIAFLSRATNLTPGHTNRRWDVFVKTLK